MFARVDVPESRRVPVRLYVDEFESMATEAFEGLIAERRRFRLALALSHQNLAQLPPKLRAAIRNNVGLQVLFRCGYGDARELERELPDGFSANDLVSFAPGEGLVMTRGRDAVHFRCNLATAIVGASGTNEFRSRVLARLGRPFSEVWAMLDAKRGSDFQAPDLRRPWGVEDQ